jgi:hypothetical protein
MSLPYYEPVLLYFLSAGGQWKSASVSSLYGADALGVPLLTSELKEKHNIVCHKDVYCIHFNIIPHSKSTMETLGI